MSRRRGGATRTEILATLAVVVLVVIGIVALWPDGGPSTGSGPSASAEPANDPAAVDPGKLAAARTAAGLYACPAPAGPPAAGPLAGVQVPCLGADGRTDVGAALAGQPAVINVWASWCAPCREELPALAEYATRPNSIAVLTVDVQDDPLAALALLRDLKVQLPAVTDPDGALRAALNVPPALPASYVVRADGTVTRIDLPVPFRSSADVQAAVERLS